jgi:hypothetical protein
MARSDRQGRRLRAALATQTDAYSSRAALGHGRQSVLLRSLAVFGLLLGLLLVASAQAQASVEGQRLHETKPSFGFSVKVVEQSKKRTPELAAVAVSAATGDVFVAESALGTVEEFEPEKNAGGETVGEKVASQKLTVASAVAVAVDNSPSPDPSAGDVYVGTSKGTLLKFIPNGGTLEETKLKGFKVTGGIKGLAIDGKGDVFVSSVAGEVTELNNAAVNAVISTEKTELAGATRSGLAVGATGELYMGSEGFSTEPGENFLLSQNKKEFEELNPEYKENSRYGVLAKLSSSGEILVPAVSPEALGAVTANDDAGPEEDNSERGDLYVVNLTGATGEKVSTVSEYAQPGEPKEVGQLLQRFALTSQGKSSEGVGVGFDNATGELYVLDAASASVDVYKFAPEGAPIVSDLSAQSSLTELETWTLGGEVNANGSDTEYHFEYGPGSCEPPAAACTSTSSVDLGASYGPQHVSVQLSGLSPGAYHYRVVAENGHGIVRSSEQSFTIAATLAGLPDGRQWELVSSPLKAGSIPEAITSEGGVIQASETGEAFTYISNGPFAGQQPEGNESPFPTQELGVRGPGGWSSTDINTAAAVASGIRVGKQKEYRFFTPSLSLSLTEPITGPGALAKPPLAANETLQKSIYLRADAPLSPEASEKVSFETALTNGGKNGNAGFLALVNNTNANIFVEGGGSAEFGGESEVEGLEFEGANANLSDVVFGTLSDDQGLYEWTGVGNALERVSILPNGKNEPNAKLGLLTTSASEGLETQDAISSDGTRVIWTSAAPKHLYVRDTATEKTLQLDTFQTEALEKAEAERKEENSPSASYVGASTDDSRVFFTDTQRLTAGSHATANSPDLYVYEFTPLGGELHDLTPQPGADVQAFKNTEGGGVLGVSEDGAYVYFVADGVLAPGASPGGCGNEEQQRPPGTTCNLYVSHLNAGTWQTKLVAALSEEDGPDWGEPGRPGRLGFQTARVSPSGPSAPSGQYLAFMSDRNLTGYEPVEEAARGGNRDEEVYLYDAATGQLTCASCSPNGAPPVGVHDVGAVNDGKSQEGIGLLVDRSQIWAEAGEENSTADHHLAGSVPGWTPISVSGALYQSRYLSNDGRLFFNSPDQLAPGASGQKEMVYEYEPNGAGSCASDGGCVALISGGDSEHEQAFLDASASGNDVFFLSTEPLAPNPEDSLSVYDAHVCESTSPCPTSAKEASVACDESVHACKNPPEPFTGGSGSPASETTSGVGNITPQLAQGAVLHEKTAVKPLTKAQKLAAALKACKKDKKKTKRQACEKAAHKKYGPPAKKSSKKTTK